VSAPEDKRRAQAAALRREIEQHVKMAEEAEIVTEGITGPIWTVIIRPYIERTLTSFQASVYSLTQEQFVTHQGIARGLNALLLYVEDKDGKKQEHLDAATKIKQKLEEAERQGLIPSAPAEE
jgi:hypothetical protein